MTQPEFLQANDLHALTGYVLRPDADAYPIGHYPKEAPGGIYMLFSEDGRLIYIGQSLSIGYRILQHAWSAKRSDRLAFTEFTALDVPNELMRHVECAHIHALAPCENTLPRPDWRHHDAMVALVKKAWPQHENAVESNQLEVEP